MKFFYLFFLFVCVVSVGFSQDSTSKSGFSQQIVKVPVSSKLDTNEVFYDESGKALHYYQYQKLLNSGQYTFTLDGPPGTPGVKKHLLKLTAQDQSQMYSVIKKLMEIKSPLLKEGTVLDVSPLSGVFSAGQLENKVVVMIFWNTDCPPCTESFAEISAFLKQVQNPENLVVLAITSNNKREAAAGLKEKPLLYSRLISGGASVFNAYQLQSYPSYVVADKTHVIRLP